MALPTLRSCSLVLFSAAGRAAGLQNVGFSAVVGRRWMSAGASTTSYKHILVDRKGKENQIGVVTFNRPKAMNALCKELQKEMASALKDLDTDASVRAIVLTGGEKHFMAGADLKEMANWKFSDFNAQWLLEYFRPVQLVEKPLIAAVNGTAFGAGCELAMMCDVVYAGDKAIFGQPEIKVGLIPGGGGTQRLPRYVGKSIAMEMVLTGEPIPVQEAHRIGLVSKVFPADKVIDEAVKLGEKIATNSAITVAMCKKSVNTGYETSLSEGLHFEATTFHSTFATEDRLEGVTAFAEKRKPNFKGK